LVFNGTVRKTKNSNGRIQSPLDRQPGRTDGQNKRHEAERSFTTMKRACLGVIKRGEVRARSAGWQVKVK